ncbi:MAG: glutathione-dependent formaldehyde dehydrogenase [Deltaproteobacteria bacterium]|nr:glutathione-dependent formaldehyde dehydrogenase [Deltaproteobacteria bacterium]
MHALVFHKPHDVRFETVPDPKIQDPRDAIVRVTSTAICGSDLHIYNGLLPQPKSMVLGHEFMGIVEEVGSEVTNLKRGDRVVVPFPIACGRCFFCTHDLPVACESSNENYGPEGGLVRQKGAGLFGYTDLYGGYDGGQAEYARVPFADFGPRVVPEELTDEQALFLTDILPTGWAAIDWARPEGGESYAIFGCGPVGLMAMKSAWMRGASQVIGVDIQPYRLAMAERAGHASMVIDASKEDAIERIRALTEGRGVDVAVDAVGMEADESRLARLGHMLKAQAGNIKALELAVRAARRGGFVSVVGVYGTDYDRFPLGQIMDKGLQLKAAQAPVHVYIDELLEHIAHGRLVANDIITHELPLRGGPLGYDVFNQKRDDCVKVVLKPEWS